MLGSCVTVSATTFRNLATLSKAGRKASNKLLHSSVATRTALMGTSLRKRLRSSASSGSRAGTSGGVRSVARRRSRDGGSGTAAILRDRTTVHTTPFTPFALARARRVARRVVHSMGILTVRRVGQPEECRSRRGECLSVSDWTAMDEYSKALRHTLSARLSFHAYFMHRSPSQIVLDFQGTHLHLPHPACAVCSTSGALMDMT